MSSFEVVYDGGESRFYPLRSQEKLLQHLKAATGEFLKDSPERHPMIGANDNYQSRRRNYGAGLRSPAGDLH
jgi:hypothetical protein